MTTTERPKLDDDWTEREALEAMAIIVASEDTRDSKTKKREKDYKDRLREFMQSMGMDELRDDETGLHAELGSTPGRTYIAVDEPSLTPEILMAAFKANLLVLNVTAWKALDRTGAPTQQRAVFSKAIREGEGTARLSVKGRDA